MSKIWKLFDGLLDGMKMLGAFCLAAMVAVTCVGVVGRIFHHPVFGTEEISSFLSVLVVAMTLPYAHREGVHIGVEILVRLLSPRHQERIRFVTNLFAFLLFTVVTWRMFLYAHTIRKSGRVSMNLGFPEHWVIYALAACFGVFSLFVLRDVTLFFRQPREMNP